ncbi:uncharacterized protein LOC131598334 [Vicia villosa]|uniref:uncharacterized protein LOC131598334 n=1 Tax=Vicia villosa TaxID=3911 RepID=UPI00273C531B|nr:uncharacterized protein LOC131598334 [Vicia villosa]
MEAVVSTSSMSILVNGSPTSEFSVSRGLRQGDPLSPFLFTIVAEGLAELVRREVNRGSYNGFRISEEVEYTLLHFADDTLMIGDGSLDNLWALKAIFRGFEMVSGLKINFSKSKLYGIGMREYDLEASSQFLGCKLDQFPCKFLGIMIGGSHRKVNFWNSVIKTMKSKLSAWKSRNLSFGGRFTLINSVLTNLPIYQLSFYNLPVKVVHQIITIQRDFLWQGAAGKRSLAWGRYGDVRERILKGAEYTPNNSDSLWWRDVMAVCEEPHGILSKIYVKLGDGNIALFWKSLWFGNVFVTPTHLAIVLEYVVSGFPVSWIRSSLSQPLFFKGRLLVDEVVVVNGLVDLVKRSKKFFLLFKVVFKKAYDFVSWSFLDYMLYTFGFNDKWRSWIRVYVFSDNLTILVNGCPTHRISIQKVLKQGDLLATFLFLLVAEGLSSLIFRAVELYLLSGVRVRASNVVVSHV